MQSNKEQEIRKKKKKDSTEKPNKKIETPSNTSKGTLD